jgi:hypothetical protein
MASKVPCETWADHQFAPRQFLNSGKDPRLGRYNRYLATCARCGKTAVEIDYLDMPVSARPDARPEDRA